MNSVLVNRRYCIMTTGINAIANSCNESPKKVAIEPVNNNTLRSDTLYFYQNERFKTLYMLSDENGNCVTIRRRVEWYDPLSDEVKSFNESTMYITGTEEL